jgi:NAD(P)-dependent dehydrogenase (short-subunit alcohol dehydrogenase family)
MIFYDLKSKKVLVIGSSTGIGAATAMLGMMKTK